MQDVSVKSITHLKSRPQADQALRILQRIASLVKPIMRKHNWVLPVLSEFFPKNPSLLGMNVNAGQKILLRLRPPHAPDTFYDEEDIMSTMLHELTHNVHGPHNDKFYKFLSELEQEYEALRKTGYNGDGFHSAGRRLGTDVSHTLPPHIARQKAIEAAEKRRQISLVLSGGGRLGGMSRSNKSPRELAAEAAERRAQDEKACATGAVAQEEADKAAKESVQDDVIDLTLSSDSESEPEIIVIDESPSSVSTPSIVPTPVALGARTPRSGYSSPSTASDSGYASTSMQQLGSGFSSSSSISTLVTTSTCPSPIPTSHPHPHVRRVARGAGDGRPSLPKPRSLSRPPASVRPKRPITPPPSRAGSILLQRPAARTATVIPAEEQWTCPRCTLVNDTLSLQCAACLAMRPGAKERERAQAREADGWTCETCGERDMPHDFWSCRFCGSVKVAS